MKKSAADHIILAPQVASVLRLLAAKGPCSPSGIGYALFPVRYDGGCTRISGPRNPQGAALAASKYIARARKLGYVMRTSDCYRWELTLAGQRALKDLP